MPQAQTQDQREMDYLLSRMSIIIAQYKGEASIPSGHEYWNACNRYRQLIMESRLITPPTLRLGESHAESR